MRIPYIFNNCDNNLSSATLIFYNFQSADRRRKQLLVAFVLYDQFSETFGIGKYMRNAMIEPNVQFLFEKLKSNSYKLSWK